MQASCRNCLFRLLKRALTFHDASLTFLLLINSLLLLAVPNRLLSLCLVTGYMFVDILAGPNSVGSMGRMSRLHWRDLYASFQARSLGSRYWNDQLGCRDRRELL